MILISLNTIPKKNKTKTTNYTSQPELEYDQLKIGLSHVNDFRTVLFLIIDM